MLKLEQGRPTDTSGRLEKEIRVYDFLDKLGVIYDRVDHEALMTMEACEEADRVLEATICKNLFLCTANKKEFYLLMIVGDKRLVTRMCQKSLVQAGFLLLMNRIWKSISISHRDLSACWGL